MRSGELPDERIKHIVVLMLENRGFDHLMGWLYGANENLAIVTRETDPDKDRFLGLSQLSQDEFAALANCLPSSTQGVAPVKGASSPKSPSFNPGEHFAHIMNQMWGSYHVHEDWENREKRLQIIDQLSNKGAALPPMTGYVQDYGKEVQQIKGNRNELDVATLREIMETYLPEQLPVLSGLARHYAVSDAWYCSVPSQTNTNRAFSMAGTSRGMVRNSFYDPEFGNPGVELFRVGQGVFSGGLDLITRKKKFQKGVSHADALPESTRSLFEVLEESNITWSVFWQAHWPPKTVSLGVGYQYVRTMFPALRDKGFDDSFVLFDATKPDNPFFQAARDGRLPAVSWVEPAWGGGPSWASPFQSDGNDLHPVADTTVGEDFVMRLYEALSQNKDAWKKTLLVITFDENGGTYDHMPPPACKAPGSACPLPGQKFEDAGMDRATRTQFGFDFRQLGVRVPTLLVSPWIDKRTVFRSLADTPFDHTSIIATLLQLARVPRTNWGLGERVAAAPTFEHLLLKAPRDDATGRPMEALKVPTSAKPPSDSANPLFTNQPYIFEYLGSRWPQEEEPAYLIDRSEARGDDNSPQQYDCPVLDKDRQKAAQFQFVPADGGKQVVPLTNMARCRIQKVGGQAMPERYISRDGLCVYFEWITNSISLWQVRLLNSRDPGDPVRTGDELYFVATGGGTRTHPIKRLTRSLEQSRFLATHAGQWGLWRIVAGGPSSGPTQVGYD